MQIKFAGVLVDDQAKALKFYTDVLGFVKHADIPFGGHRWLTVIAPQGVVGAELVLEPMGFPPAKEVAVRCRNPGYRFHDHQYPG